MIECLKSTRFIQYNVTLSQSSWLRERDIPMDTLYIRLICVLYVCVYQSHVLLDLSSNLFLRDLWNHQCNNADLRTVPQSCRLHHSHLSSHHCGLSPPSSELSTQSRSLSRDAQSSPSALCGLTCLIATVRLWHHVIESGWQGDRVTAETVTEVSLCCSSAFSAHWMSWIMLPFYYHTQHSLFSI